MFFDRPRALTLGELILLNRLKAEERMALGDQVHRAVGNLAAGAGLRPHVPGLHSQGAGFNSQGVIVPKVIPRMAARKFPFLESLSTEIDKLGFEIEEEAKSIVQKDIAEVRTYKTQVFSEVRTAVASNRAAIDDMKTSLEKVLSAIGGNG